MARKLWMNAIDFTTIAPFEEGQLFYGVENPSVIDPVMQNRDFVAVPAGVSRRYSCPSGLPNPLAAH